MIKNSDLFHIFTTSVVDTVSCESTYHELESSSLSQLENIINIKYVKIEQKTICYC